MIDRTFDQATTGCLSVVISAIVGFHLLIPLMAVFDAMDWPIFHSWGIWHDSIIVAWPALALVVLGVLRSISVAYKTGTFRVAHYCWNR